FLRYVFFFQAEDGIRDATVTGVQTCALPIWLRRRQHPLQRLDFGCEYRCQRLAAVLESRLQTADQVLRIASTQVSVQLGDGNLRSEERRVGKECESRRVAES